MSDSSIWEDQIFTVDSTGGEEGYTFQASYRICPGSCEPAEISPPIISIRNLAGSPILILHEDRENIAGFRIYVDGVQIDSIGNDNFSFIIDGYKPPCGQTREYYVTAFNDMRESPPSNVEYLTADPCPRRLRITFERIITGWSWGGLPDLYDISGSDTMGPIYGRFNVYSGYPIHSFVFDTSECIWVSILRYCGGLRLRPTREYDIMEDVFREEYEAPDRNYFTIEFDLEDDVTIGGDIEDRDGFGGDDRMFDGTISMRARDILPGEYPIGDRNIILMVNIEELPTP